MIKAMIQYADGTETVVKKKSYIELAAYMEKERENGAVWFKARSDSGSRIESREYNGRPIYAEVR